MKQLQTLLRRFLDRDIGLEELQRKFSLLLAEDADLAASAAAWLDAGERDGLLSAAVCTSLKNVLVKHFATYNRGPDPKESGIFDTLDANRKKVTSDEREEKQSDIKEPVDTFVRDADSTVLGSSADVESVAAAPGRRSTDRVAKVDTILRVGSVIGSRYELLSQLGSGGMGMVFKARDRLRAEAQDRNPFVALKVLSERFKEHPDSMIALQRESRRAQSLAHPNVITVHEFYSDDPHFYMTMELLNGKPLDQLIQSDYAHGLSFEKVWPIIESVGRALEYGHKKGIVHSDVKPGNIFVCDDGTVKVLDFGISRPIPIADVPTSEQTVFDPGKRLGSLTPAYASLEMWQQDTPDPRDDIYALGCVAYLLLTGTHPFDGQSAKIAYDDELVPQKISTLSRGQWFALSGALELRRKNRTKSVRQFLAQFSPQSVVRARRRIGILLVALAASIVAAAAIRYYGIVQQNRAFDDFVGLDSPIETPVERPELSDEQQQEIDSLLELGQELFTIVNIDSSIEDLDYYLTSGMTNVVQIANRVLDTDPGRPEALALREQVYEIYMDKADRLRDRREFAGAFVAIRNALAIKPRARSALQMRSGICDDAPTVCERN